MAAAVEVFTPVFRAPDTASPATRRRRPLALISNNTPLNDLTLNDDAAEKRQRRLSRVTSVALSSPATGTPRTQSRLDSERNMTTKSGLSNLQLKDLYSNCIKLSTENKINSKNAFGLHLIDYMQDLIKTVKEGEMTNFQVASCTLDASAKIYAGRVDSIHSQAYKMLSGLGRTENDQENQGENAADDVPGGKQRTRKAHSKPGNTIETNIKNLNVNQFDLEFEVDPLFHKTSAAFDEGGTVGLLMNNLFVRDDTCEILLDSNAIAMTTRDSTTQGQTSQDANMVDLSELREAYSNVNFEAYQICPYFSEFEFTNWNKNDEGNNAINSIISKYKNDEHAFDVDAPATEVEYPEPVAGDYSDDDMPDMGEDIEYGHDGCEAVNGGIPAAYSLANATLAFADGQEARLINSQDPRSTANTLGSLCLELSEKPNEYSYFKSSVLATWAGPEHWKMKARLSKLAGITTSTSSQDQDTKKKKARKEPFKIDFDKELDIKQYFSKGRASTTLAKSTLQNMSSLRTTLPEDLHYNADNLFRLFTKPKILVRRQAQQTEVADDGSEWYNYNNANDAANFCPDLQDDDDDHPGDAANEGQDMTCTEGVNPDMTYDITNSSQGLSFSNETAMDLTMFAGDGLVAQPNKVAKIDICYSKTAKKMDVKKLKAAMWGLLTKENPHKENMANEASEEPDLEEHEQDNTKSFKDVYEQLPSLISKNMTKNLSIPIAFVCILHLANEKCLKMLKDDEMANFGIALEKV